MSDWDVVETTPAAVQTDPEPADDNLTTGSTGNDDWSVVSTQPAQAPQQAPQAQAQDEWAVASQDPAPGGEWSQAGSAAMGAVKGAVPTTAGLGAGLYAGAAASPFVTPVGGVLVGLGVGALTSWMAGMGQDKLLAALEFDKPFKEAEKANPLSFFAGEMAPGAALLRPGGALLDRAIGGAIGGAAETGIELLQGEGLNPGKIAIAAAGGAALPNVNRLGSKVIASGEQVASRYRSGNNANPDLKEIPLEPGQTPDIMLNDTPTPSQMEAANQQPKQAAGTADVQPPPPEVPNVGNPEGAPMQARVASKHEGREYPKTEVPAGVEQPAVVHNETPVTPDVATAMKGDAPEQVQQPPVAADVPAPADAAPTISERPAPPPPAPESKVFEFKPNNQKPHRTEAAPDSLVQSPENTAVSTPDVQNAPKSGNERVATGLTPEEIKVSTRARAALKQLGYDKLLAEIENRGLSHKEVAQALTKAYNMSQSASGEAAGRTTGEVRTETPRAKTATGIVANSKALAAKKDAAFKYATDAYNKHREALADMDPLDPAKRAENRERMKAAWADVVAGNNGRDPTVRSKDQYVPLKQGEGHAEAYQWLKALKQAATGQNQKNFAALHKTKGMGEVIRETGKIEGDIARRPQLPEAAEQAETAVQPGTPRETFEQLPMQPGKDNTFAKQHNEVVDWVNNLSNEDFAVLSDHYKQDLRPTIIDMMEPKDTLNEMMDVLKQSGRRQTGKTPKGEITTEVELPAKKVDLPEVPPAGRKLDKNSDEFKRLAAQYNAYAAKEKPLTKAEQIARSEAREASLKEATTRTEHREVIDSTNPESVWKKAADFIKDEGGAGRLHVPAMQLWTRFRNPSNPSTPAASQGAKDYARTLSDSFRRITGDTLHRKLDLQANMHAGIAEAERLGINTPYWYRKIALAEQDNRVGGLPQHVREFYEKFIVPVRERGLEATREMVDLNKRLNLGWDLHDVGKVTTKSYQPRYQVGKQGFDDKAAKDAFDPFTGRTLSGWAPNLLDRKWYSLEATGPGAPHMRMVFERTPQGDVNAIRLWRPNMPTIRIKTPSTFEGKVGDTLELKVGGKPIKFTVDQATTKEIDKATGGQVKFHENSLWAWTKMADDMTNAVEQAKLYDSIKSSPEYKALATTDREVARERGYSMQPTRLKDFATEGQYKRDVYLPDAVRWAFDDYNRPGFGGNSEGLEKLRNFNVAMLKVFNTNAPLVHVLNEANLFAVGRGFKWLSPKSNWGLAKNIGTAMRSVNTQDSLQREMRNAGVNPLLATTKVGNMFKGAAEAMGMEVTRNWRAWDAPFKPMGITAKEAGEKLYQLSSDVTWRLSDYMTTLRYMEERAAGWGPEDAAKRVNKFMSDYQVDSTIMGSRALQQFLTDPLTTSFGRYKAGVWRSLATMVKDLVKGDDMLRQQAGKAGFGAAMSELKARQEALGQLLAVGVIATLVGPAADKAIQKLTGDENAEFRARGVNAPVHAALKYREKGVQGVVTHAWSPSPFLGIAGELPGNKNFSGKEIIPTGDLPGIIPEALASAGEYALATAVPPYANVSKTYSRPEGSLPLALGNLALEQIGGDIKSDAAVKRSDTIDRILNRNQRMRDKRPGGIIPDALNRVID